MNKLLYRPKEAAQMLGIGRDKFYDLMRSGRLRSLELALLSDARQPRSLPWCWPLRPEAKALGGLPALRRA
jgi:hypothetical protein